MFLNSENKLKTNGVHLSTCTHSGNSDSRVDLDNFDVLSRFCLPLCSREVKVREVALAEIEHRLGQWLQGEGTGVSNGVSQHQQLVTLHVPTLLRLSVSCPFHDVRAKCTQILRTISERGFPVPFNTVCKGASSFIPSQDARNENIVIMTATEVKELRDPNWILDRRNSGKLFWRRDSAGEKNRVKFRCDVEVLEYLRAEAERSEQEYDWSDDEDDDRRHRWGRRDLDEEIPPPSNLLGGVCVLVIVAVLTYQWFSV